MPAAACMRQAGMDEGAAEAGGPCYQEMGFFFFCCYHCEEKSCVGLGTKVELDFLQTGEGQTQALNMLVVAVTLVTQRCFWCWEFPMAPAFNTLIHTFPQRAELPPPAPQCLPVGNGSVIENKKTHFCPKIHTSALSFRTQPHKTLPAH